MLKFTPQDTTVVFAEIPDEICLAINLSRCPHRCPGCHSPYLQTDVGEELTENTVYDLINKNRGITCVLFMGGDGDKETLIEIAECVKRLNLKTAWYSGEESIDFSKFQRYFNYIKIGPYIRERGPLNNPSTNQRLYLIDGDIKDITNRFWKHGTN